MRNGLHVRAQFEGWGVAVVTEIRPIGRTSVCAFLVLIKQQALTNEVSSNDKFTLQLHFPTTKLMTGDENSTMVSNVNIQFPAVSTISAPNTVTHMHLL